MKNSIFILVAFSIGLIIGKFAGEIFTFTYSDLTQYILLFLLLLVGIDLGSDSSLYNKLKNSAWQSAIFPIVPIIGTYAGCFIYTLIQPAQPAKEIFAIGSGLGFYSLTGAIITNQSGIVFGTLAVLVNLIREIATLTLTPLFTKYLGPWSPIASGGATAMDTTLPIIARFSGDEYVIPSVYSGVVLTLIVPLLLSLIYFVF